MQFFFLIFSRFYILLEKKEQKIDFMFAGLEVVYDIYVIYRAIVAFVGEITDSYSVLYNWVRVYVCLRLQKAWNQI